MLPQAAWLAFFYFAKTRILND